MLQARNFVTLGVTNLVFWNVVSVKYQIRLIG